MLSEEQVFGDKAIDVIKEIGGKCVVSDLAILLGTQPSFYSNFSSIGLKERTCIWCTLSCYPNTTEYVTCVDFNGLCGCAFIDLNCFYAIRPVLKLSDKIDINSNSVYGSHRFIETEYGEYIQYAIGDSDVAKKYLEVNYSDGKLQKTGKTYSIYLGGTLKTFFEYEYNGKRYVRIDSNPNNSSILSNCQKCSSKPIWFEVAPIKWIVDKKANLLISKIALLGGIPFCDDPNKYSGDFKSSKIYNYLNTVFCKDIIPSKIKEAYPKVQVENIEKINASESQPKLKKEEIHMVLIWIK